MESLPNINEINFGKTLYGSTLIGAHFGNVAQLAKNVSVFWLFDFGGEGVEHVSLNNIQGFSNAVLFNTGPVPEPGTWALLLLGLAALGGTMRARHNEPRRSVSYTRDFMDNPKRAVGRSTGGFCVSFVRPFSVVLIAFVGRLLTTQIWS